MQSPFLCKSTIYMLSKRLELIPNFQELFIIIITISPQAADNTLFRIITHFDLDKEKNNEIERNAANAANASIYANNIFHSSQGREHSQTKNWSFSSEYSFWFCYSFALGPWSHISILAKTHWVVFSYGMFLVLMVFPTYPSVALSRQGKNCKASHRNWISQVALLALTSRKPQGNYRVAAGRHLGLAWSIGALLCSAGHGRFSFPHILSDIWIKRWLTYIFQLNFQVAQELILESQKVYAVESLQRTGNKF